MKKRLLFMVLFALVCLQPLMAQDIILKMTGEEIKAKVMEISLSQVRFKLTDSPTDSVHALPRSEVFMITFANGAKEVLNQEPADTTSAEVMTPQQMYQLGTKDAKAYYKGRDVIWASAATTMLFLPAPIIMGAIPPKIKPTEVSNIDYLKNNYYVKGYKKQAHKKKIGKVAIGTGVGLLTTAAISVIVFMTAMNSM
ncbi:hypothetical protein GU926_03755 [Nibribacter ruber]|uniref:Uncharacterized protein n=1 Tax=Nibribacter ruber TaxID=2698458 RepID=A0A6P1NY16_9BACT|nr:hypothetical protein [Nibribacter ruber]QHL86601.1 hypothetical protein GU926_03755 [Nibribacter ruber]